MTPEFLTNSSTSSRNPGKKSPPAGSKSADRSPGQGAFQQALKKQSVEKNADGKAPSVRQQPVSTESEEVIVKQPVTSETSPRPFEKATERSPIRRTAPSSDSQSVESQPTADSQDSLPQQGTADSTVDDASLKRVTEEIRPRQIRRIDPGERPLVGLPVGEPQTQVESVPSGEPVSQPVSNQISPDPADSEHVAVFESSDSSDIGTLPSLLRPATVQPVVDENVGFEEQPAEADLPLKPDELQPAVVERSTHSTGVEPASDRHQVSGGESIPTLEVAGHTTIPALQISATDPSLVNARFFESTTTDSDAQAAADVQFAEYEILPIPTLPSLRPEVTVTTPIQPPVPADEGIKAAILAATGKAVEESAVVAETRVAAVETVSPEAPAPLENQSEEGSPVQKQPVDLAADAQGLNESQRSLPVPEQPIAESRPNESVPLVLPSLSSGKRTERPLPAFTDRVPNPVTVEQVDVPNAAATGRQSNAGNAHPTSDASAPQAQPTEFVPSPGQISADARPEVARGGNQQTLPGRESTVSADRPTIPAENRSPAQTQAAPVAVTDRVQRVNNPDVSEAGSTTSRETGAAPVKVKDVSSPVAVPTTTESSSLEPDSVDGSSHSPVETPRDQNRTRLPDKPTEAESVRSADREPASSLPPEPQLETSRRPIADRPTEANTPPNLSVNSIPSGAAPDQTDDDPSRVEARPIDARQRDVERSPEVRSESSVNAGSVPAAETTDQSGVSSEVSREGQAEVTRRPSNIPQPAASIVPPSDSRDQSTGADEPTPAEPKPVRVPAATVSTDPSVAESSDGQAASSGNVHVESASSDGLQPVTEEMSQESVVAARATGLADDSVAASMSSPSTESATTSSVTVESAAAGSATATTPSAASASPTPSVSAPSRELVVPMEIQEAVSAIQDAASGDQHVRVRLNPRELGTMLVDVTRTETGIVARLEVESAAARVAIMESLPDLQQSLSRSGSGVERVEVVLNESRTESGRQDGDQSSQRDQQQSRQERQSSGQRQSREEQNQRREQRQQQESPDPSQASDEQGTEPRAADELDISL